MEEIWRAIKEANLAWKRGEPEATASLFADDVVMVAPAAGVRISGRDAMVKSFVDYCAAARTHFFEERSHDIDVRGDLAVATYTFAVRYEVEGKTFDDEGQEVLVFARGGGAWKAIWRTQVTTSSREVEPAPVVP